MINLSTGAKKALLAASPGVQKQLIAATISFGDGTGTGGRDQILDADDGLAAVFGKQDHILVIGGTNNNKLVEALTVADGVIEVAAGSFATESAGDPICLVMISSGAFSQVFKNCKLDIRSDIRPANADLTETGTKLLSLTKNAGAFVAGSSENGFNFGSFSGTTMQMAIDPATGLPEVVRGIGLVTGTPGWGRLYANAYVTGASTDAVRADGVVEVSGADINLSTGKSITAGVYSELTGFNVTASGASV